MSVEIPVWLLWALPIVTGLALLYFDPGVEILPGWGGVAGPVSWLGVLILVMIACVALGMWIG